MDPPLPSSFDPWPGSLHGVGRVWSDGAELGHFYPYVSVFGEIGEIVEGLFGIVDVEVETTQVVDDNGHPRVRFGHGAQSWPGMRRFSSTRCLRTNNDGMSCESAGSGSWIERTITVWLRVRGQDGGTAALLKSTK